jgi:hypothetical protein
MRCRAGIKRSLGSLPRGSYSFDPFIYQLLNQLRRRNMLQTGESNANKTSAGRG